MLKLNDYVRNFGIYARVVGFHEITGEPIGKWLADTAKCEPITECVHKNALIAEGGGAV